MTTLLRSAVNLVAPRDELADIANEAQSRFDGAPAEAVIEWAAETFGSRFCITSSMADGVLAHIASRVAPGVDVVFLDTGLHFPQTLQVRDQVAQTMPVRVLSIQPVQTVGQQDGSYGPGAARSADDDRGPGCRDLPGRRAGWLYAPGVVVAVRDGDRLRPRPR